MLVAVDDVVGRQVLEPNLRSFVVAAQAFFGRAFENGGIEVGWVELQHVDEVFPSHVDGAFFEVVAKTPVAEHFKHGVVVSVVSHLFQVVVLAAYAETFLRVGAAARFWVARAEDDVFPLVHTRIGKHERGVVFDYHRG